MILDFSSYNDDDIYFKSIRVHLHLFSLTNFKFVQKLYLSSSLHFLYPKKCNVSIDYIF